MSLRSDPVAMPEKKVTFKKAANGTVYVYYTLRAYRNNDGKPTSDEVAIGKKDPDTGMLIPNRMYFELFHSSLPKVEKEPSKATPPCRAASYGNTYSLMEMARSTGLRATMEKCFPDKWRQMLAAAFYMLCEGNVMMYIDDWFDETDVHFAERMDDYQCSRLFASITYSERAGFFKEWVKARSEQEYIAYDVTSVSTYSKGIDIAEWGYNRDNEKLAQVNIGMFYGAESRLPVYYDLYNGSVADKSRLTFMMGGAEKLGIANARFVLDRGFVSEDNMRYMVENNYLFVTALPGHWLEAKRIISEHRNDVRKAVNRISKFDAYALPIDCSLYGFKMKAHLYFNAEKQAVDEKALYAHIERLEADLEKMGKGKRATNKYTDLFVVEQERPGIINFESDYEKIDERLSYAGYFILLSNDESLGSDDVLRIYRGKDIIEKNFDQLKNNLDFKRLRTHANQTTDGKMFVGFLALILRSFLLGKLKGDKKTKHLTLEKTLIEFRKIKSITFEDLTRMLMPLTKRQRTILEVIGISPKKLIDSFT
jgi:transposase